MDYIDSYKDVFGTRRFTSFGNLKPGSIVQFTYDTEQKYAMVLDPDWEGKMHALSLRGLSVNNLQDLLKEVSKENSSEAIYSKYKSSTYAETRPYRTYTISKIKYLREIYLKPIKKEKSE